MFSYIFASAFFIISAVSYCIAFIGAKRLSPAVSLPMGASGLLASFWLHDTLQFEYTISYILSVAFILLSLSAFCISVYGFTFAKKNIKCVKCGSKSIAKYCPECGEKLRF